jgi:hypothetical protein
MIEPLATRMSPPKYLPETLIGEQFIDVSINGTITGGLRQKPNTNQIKTNLNVSTGIRHLTIKLPGNQGQVQDASIEVAAKGSQKHLKIEISSNIARADGVLPGKKKNASIAKIENFELKQIFNAENRTRGIPKSLTDLTIKAATKLRLGALALPDILKNPVENSELMANATISAGTFAKLESLSLIVPSLNASLSASAFSKLNQNLRPQKASASLSTDLSNIPKDYIVGYQAEGAISTTFFAHTDDMSTLFVRGSVALDHVKISSKTSGPDAIAIENLDGVIPIKLALNLTNDVHDTQNDVEMQVNLEGDDPASDGRIRQIATAFLEQNKTPETEDTSIAVTADYENFRSFFPDRKPITITQVKAKGLAIENTEIELAIEQNMIAMNNFSTVFLGGKIQGDAKILFKNRLTAIKAAAHLTRLDTERLVKTIPGLRKKARGLFGTSDPYLDATTHIQYDLITGDMLGGLNITSIGKDQLRMIMYYLDPTDSDTSISAIKAALNIGEIKLVSVPIKNGDIGVDVDVRLLAAPIPTPKIQGFPIAKLVSNFQSQEDATNDAAH